MAVQRLSRQELIRRKRRSRFVGRDGELATFKGVLRNPPEEADEFIFHIRGPAGVGKSTLVRQMEAAARDTEAITTYVDESVADALEAMEAINSQLAQQGIAMKSFDKKLGIYKQRRHEADVSAAMAAAVADTPGPISQNPVEPIPSPSTVIASQIGLVGLGMIPGVGPFAGAVDPQQIAIGASQFKAMLSSRFGNRDDVQLVLSPLQELTPIFLQDLSEIAHRQSWMVLFFDTYERTSPVLDSWLRDVLLSDRYGELPSNVLVTLAGQSQLEEQYWGDFVDLIIDLPLEVFTETEARQLLIGKGVVDERVIEVILQLSGRLPVLVSTLAESRPNSVDEVGDPSGTAVERFLKWETDAARRSAALACALPQELDEDTYRAAVEDDASDLFDWLKSLPFVHYRSGRCQYHDVVRATMLRLQRQQSPARWQRQHEHLAEIFCQRKQELKGESSSSRDWWGDEEWRSYRIQENYHRVCANPRDESPSALRGAMDAYEYGGLNAARRWAQTLVKAGRDSDTPRISDWGHELLTALESDTPGLEYLTLFINSHELNSGDRARAYTLRGRNRRKDQDYEQALNDFASALALNSETERAHHGRAITYQLMGRFDDAVSDFNRALELNPERASLFAGRGTAHFFAHRFDNSVADLNRALELAPGNSRAHTSRGLSYHFLERYDDALADFNRALDLAPDSARAHIGRGRTYQFLKRYDEALADFARALELGPDNANAHTSRGQVLRLLKRYDEALADFTRALELDPDNVDANTTRGQAHQSMKRYDEALADFARALELDPENANAHTHRGLTYQSMERYNDALTDFTRALELNPEDAGAHTSRGLSYQSLKRYEDALADFNRALELDSGNFWAHISRGLSYQSLKRHEDALADFGYALELDPQSAHPYALRGLCYQSMKRYEDALADFNRALDADPHNAHAYTNRGLALESLKRYDEALADFTRALELDPHYINAHTSRGQVFRQLKRHDEALADFSRALELDPDNAHTLTSRGRILGYMERFDDALVSFNRALEINPHNVTALTDRGLTYQFTERNDEALADFGHALEIDPGNADVHANRGHLFQRLKRHEEALADFTRAIELDPDNELAIASRGRTYQFLARYDDALGDFTRAIELDPNDARSHLNRGQTLRMMERSDHALANFARAIELDPDNVLAITGHGLACRYAGRYRDSISDYNRALSLDPEDTHALTERGQVLRLSGRYDEALADFTRALELEPNSAHTLTSRGQALRIMGRYDDALADHNRAIQLDPQVGWAHYEKAVVLHATLNGRRKEHLSKAIKVVNSNADGISKKGNVFLTDCLVPRWQRARESFEIFMSSDPAAGHVDELLKAIQSLSVAIPSRREHLIPFCQRLKEVIAASGGVD